MNTLKAILSLFLCVLLQGLLFSHLSVFGAVMLIYVVALLKMPVMWPHSGQILLGFVTGLLVDVFCNTPGMHALAATTLMAVRRPFLLANFFDSKVDVKEGFLGFHSLESSKYATFTAFCIAGYSLLLYLIESFSLFNFQMLLIKVVLGALLTFAAAMAVEFVDYRR